MVRRLALTVGLIVLALADSTTHAAARDQHQFTPPYAMKP